MDRTEVPVIGELNNIHMQLSSNPRIQHFIDIFVVDIPDGYGMVLGRDWTRRLNGFFATDFSHIWLPWKGIPNQIRIESTPRLKLMITEYGENNEILFCETDLGPKVLMLHCSDNQRDSLKSPYSIKVPMESDEELSPDEGESMFENFRRFVLKSARQERELGSHAFVQDLLLPNW